MRWLEIALFDVALAADERPLSVSCAKTAGIVETWLQKSHLRTAFERIDVGLPIHSLVLGACI